MGFNFSHIQAKSLTVLNPLQRIDEHIMDDADLAGPLLFWLCFGTFLLFVSLSLSLQVPLNFYILSLSVWESAFWLHIRCWPSRVYLYLYTPQPHVGKRHRCIPCRVCSGILSIAHGGCRRYQRYGHTRVRYHGSLFESRSCYSFLIEELWATCSPFFLSFGAHMQRQVYLLRSFKCPTRGYWWRILLDFCMVALRY